MRTGAARTDLEQSDLVDAGDRAAAGADLDELDRRNPDRQPAALHESFLACRLERVRRERLAAVHERQLRGRPAHVEGQQVAVAVLTAEEGRRERAGRGP